MLCAGVKYCRISVRLGRVPVSATCSVRRDTRVKPIDVKLLWFDFRSIDDDAYIHIYFVWLDFRSIDNDAYIHI